ncbi:alpha-1,3-mannosyl-glycoprotein 4-beta-N-acetylglucosaminyltransferase C isoform X2 [Engraulis encrasicolus]|uniref:alpha-1,3-mannosyl-glycoprotein 4-beta-N-acetylglucosaminyltransferase C isoform X2 n=1 Tax=Engraulis encrasicolus TaxID=184585 RepID=UPI002FD669CA
MTEVPEHGTVPPHCSFSCVMGGRPLALGGLSAMRLYWGAVIRSALAVVIFIGLYVSVAWKTSRPMDTRDIEQGSRSWLLTSQISNSLPLNVTIELILGVFLPEKKYLTVGLSSVKRKREGYLMETLRSIFSQSTKQELSEMVVVVFLADFDKDWVYATAQEISASFNDHVTQGQLLVAHVSRDFYPPLTGLKRNFNDAPDRVTYRSKQNVDYSYLVHLSANLSQYYLMLEDDVLCSKRFLSSIRQHVLQMGSKRWTTLEFSKLGYIGKLYHSSDLPLLARFLYLFYQEMPCDFLLTHFRTLLMQDKVIRMKPSLFQHIGKFSSFQGTYNKLKDEDFQEEPSDNPPATVVTNIVAYAKHPPENAYSQGTDFFWGKSPKKGDYLLVVFQTPLFLSRVSVKTGEEQKDILQSATLLVGHRGPDSHSKCSDFHSLGSFQAGRFEMEDLNQEVKSTVTCLKIEVTEEQRDWVKIPNIQDCE